VEHPLAVARGWIGPMDEGKRNQETEIFAKDLNANRLKILFVHYGYTMDTLNYAARHYTSHD
jgi:hypothetical protein